MKRVSLVMPYYDNPGMLAIHYRTLAALPLDMRKRIEVVIVDDGSPDAPAVKVPRIDGLPELFIFRVLVDKPWHQHAARNIGAHEATSPWLVMTDMDHVVPEETWAALFAIQNGSKVYTFARVDAPDLKPKFHPVSGEPHPHPNSFAMTKALYWQVGGYDEDFCGIYGTDGLFRSRLFSTAKHVALDAPLIRYPREVQPDASTRTLPRKEGRPEGAKQAVLERKRAEGREGVPGVLSMPYERVYPL